MQDKVRLNVYIFAGAGGFFWAGEYSSSKSIMKLSSFQSLILNHSYSKKMVVLIIEKYLCVVLVDKSYKSANEYYESQSVRQNAWGDIENPSMTYNKMGTLFRDLRRQFVSFTWMSGVFYMRTIYIQLSDQE